MSKNKFEWLVIVLALLALVFSNPCNAQRSNYNNRKPGGIMQMYREMGKKKPQRVAIPRRWADIVVDVEGSRIINDTLFEVKYMGNKNFNFIVDLVTCWRKGSGCTNDRYAVAVSRWSKWINAYKDFTGYISFRSPIWYRIGDNRVTSNRYNNLTSARNGQGKAILSTTKVRLNTRAMGAEWNIAPRASSMMAINRSRDLPYRTKGIFRLDRAMRGLTFRVPVEVWADGRLLIRKSVWVRVI